MNSSDEKTRISNPLPQDTAGGATDKGPIRNNNQDAFMLPDPAAPTDLGLIYIVADGVGGQEHGAEASQLAVRIIHDLYYQTRQVGESAAVAMRHAAEQANMAIYDEAQTRGEGKMGCTAVAVVHDQNQRLILHAGDARAYLLRNGVLEQLTRDDTWVQRQVEEGIIGEETAARHELRHVVTRVLGNKPTLELTLSEPSPIEPGDILLLCSDGLYDVVSKEEIKQILAGYSPQAAADALVQAAINAAAKDNITAVVISSQLSHHEQKTVSMPTVAVSGAPEEATAPTTINGRRERNGIRLPLWALAAIAVTVVFTIIFGAVALWRQLRPSTEAPLPTSAAIAPGPTATAADTTMTLANATPTLLPTSPPPATPTPQAIAIPPTEPASATDPAPPEGTAVSNLACVVSPGAFTFVWQDSQINGSACDQFAAEDYVLNDGDQVIVIDPTPIGVLGPDPICVANQFIKIQSVANPAIEGWALERNIQSTTPEQGCPP